MKKQGTMKKGRWTLLCVGALALLYLNQRGAAQDIVDAAAADLDDFRTSFRNPASLPFLPDQLIFGTTASEIGVNPGFFDINNGYVSYYSPYWRKRFGLNGQFLNTGIFRRTNFGFSYGERIHPAIAVGGRFDLLNQDFDPDRFQGVDPGDPVLSSGLSKNYVSFTVGLLAVPIPEVSIGAVVENINRPDVALSQDSPFRLPAVYDVGFQYRTDRFHPSVNLRYEDGVVRYRLRLGFVFMDDHLVRFDYRKEKIGLEGQLRLYRGFHLNYRYNYPLNELSTFSNGSHNLSFVYDFTRLLDLPELSDLEYHPERLPVTRSVEPIPIEGDFFVVSSVRSLEIWEKNITRKADDDIPLDFIRRNYHRIFEEKEDRPLSDFQMTPFYPDTLQGLTGTYTDRYRYSLDSLAAFLEEAEETETAIYTSEEDLLRAANLREFLADRSDVPPDRITILRQVEPPGKGVTSEGRAESTDNFREASRMRMSTEEKTDSPARDEVDLSLIGKTETSVTLSVEEIEFRILSLNTDDYTGSWSLVIQDGKGNPVKSFTGTGEIPNRIVWDWLDENGNLIQPGWYSYLFRWEDGRNGLKETPQGRLTVKKNKKNITIELTRKRRLRGLEAQRMELRLDQ